MKPLSRTRMTSYQVNGKKSEWMWAFSHQRVKKSWCAIGKIMLSLVMHGEWTRPEWMNLVVLLYLARMYAILRGSQWPADASLSLSFPHARSLFPTQKGSTLRGGKDLVLNNSEESMFLFVNRLLHPQNPSKSAIFKLKGICLNLPQDLLMCWGLGSIDEVLQPFMTWAEEMWDTIMKMTVGQIWGVVSQDILDQRLSGKKLEWFDRGCNILCLNVVISF